MMPTGGDAHHPCLSPLLSGDGQGLSRVCLFIPAPHRSGLRSSCPLVETPAVVTSIFIIITAGGSGSCEIFDRDNEEAHCIFIVGCTNCPWEIDDAIMWRFQQRIHVPLPNDCSQKALLGSRLKNLDKGGGHNLSSVLLMVGRV